MDQFLGQAGVFGYHMWTQAWIQDPGDDTGRWVDLDATLPDRSFDASHIALATSAMADDTMVNDVVAMARMFGRVKIKVVDARTTPANQPVNPP